MFDLLRHGHFQIQSPDPSQMASMAWKVLEHCSRHRAMQLDLARTRVSKRDHLPKHVVELVPCDFQPLRSCQWIATQARMAAVV
jgi:hypothetical protein